MHNLLFIKSVMILVYHLYTLFGLNLGTSALKQLLIAYSLPYKLGYLLKRWTHQQPPLVCEGIYAFDTAKA